MSNTLFDALFGHHQHLTPSQGAAHTHQGFLEGVARMAHAMVAAGLTPGDREAVQMAKSSIALAIYPAAVQADGAE